MSKVPPVPPDSAEDEVLRRMLATPPAPNKAKPAPVKKQPSKKP